MTKAKSYFTNAEPEDIEVLETKDLIVTGITSIGNVTSNTVTVNILGIGTTSPQYNLDVIGDVNFTGSVLQNGSSFVPQYSNISELSTYSDSSGISTVTQGITGTPNITVGIITANSYTSFGTTVVYTGINTSLVDSNTNSVHYVSFNTNSSAVDISNFYPNKELRIVARNTSPVGARTLIIRTSETDTNFQIVPTIVHSAGTISNGTISVPTSSGILISVFNVSGTVVAHY